MALLYQIYPATGTYQLEPLATVKTVNALPLTADGIADAACTSLASSYTVGIQARPPLHHPRNENGPRSKTATGSVDFVVDLELADEVEGSPHRKRRGFMKSKRSIKDDAAGKYLQILKGVHATEKDVGSEDAHIADHREPYEGIAAYTAVSHPMNTVRREAAMECLHLLGRPSV
jgi:hypothetical protein